MPRRTAPILTVGHSVRPLASFLGLLAENGVGTLVDVRALPRSRRHPHFSAGPLAAALAAAGIAYRHLPELGGLRTPGPDSPHTALRQPMFRAYADHMAGASFGRALDEVEALARGGIVALMCAEGRPEDCHRSLIADALTVRGRAVEHIVAPGPRQPHRLTAVARVAGGRLIYDGGQQPLAGVGPETPASPARAPRAARRRGRTSRPRPARSRSRPGR